MKITQEAEAEHKQAVLHIELEDEDLDPYLDRGYQRVLHRTAVPGFRKGKAPRRILERFVGRESLLSEVLDYMVTDVARRAIEAQEIDATGTPKVELLEMEPVTVKATVALRPEVELGDYQQIRVPLEPFEVGDADVRAQLEKIRESVTPWEPAERPVEAGDLITMDLSISAEDRVVFEKRSIVLLAGEDELKFTGLSEQLLGAVRDEPKMFTLKLPDDFPEEAAAGKDAQFTATVSEIKTRNLPELDDEFAKSVGNGYESLDALRKEVEEELNKEAQQSQKDKHAEASVAALVGGATIELAPVLVDHELDHMMSDRESALSRADIRMDDFLRASGRTAEQAREELRDRAMDRLKRSFAITAFADHEGIEVADEEIDERIRAISGASEGRHGPGRNVDLESDEARGSIRQAMLTERSLDRLVAIANGELAEEHESEQETSEDDQAPDEGGNAV